MTQEPESCDSLYLFESVEQCLEHTRKLISNARRKLYILSHQLDPLIYDRDDIASELSQFARRARDCQVHILVRDTADMLERGHRLARLHQRLPSKIQLRKLALEPNNQQMGFIAADRNLLVYKNDDTQPAGFANYRAAPEVKNLTEEYQRIWQHAVAEPGLQLLSL
ncbi:DUF7931 domain-containing protein [Gilvimarinus polysaccharolyticus]|uniref:DUF7931 domain-containing protein n=1 Tax=Gilvimarinus polysaccharolyticus TaxID=863921 RepID=UPI00067335DF|nr:hypothetical protein [Gilvimarinus polysaccharolyticus]